MKYKTWTYRGGSLIVEKYHGEFSNEVLQQNEEEMFQLLENADDQLLILSDIREASFPDLTLEDMKEIIQVYEVNNKISQRLKTAIVTGANHFEDFNRAVDYAKISSENSTTMLVFNFLDSAMDWLRLDEDEKSQIKSDLADF